MQIGSKGSPERKRADEIAEYVIEPSLPDSGLEMYRADLDPTPGQVTPQIIKKLIDAAVVIADLTGSSPNAYYELGIAHSFGHPVIVMCDNASSLAFDTKDERTITLGDPTKLGVVEAEEAKKLLKEALKTVLAPGHRPSSVVTEVADSRNLDQLTPENPLTSVVAELAIIRENTEDLLRGAKPAPARQGDPDLAALLSMVEKLVDEGKVGQRHLLAAKSKNTSEAFNMWVDEQRRTVRRRAEIAQSEFGAVKRKIPGLRILEGSGPRPTMSRRSRILPDSMEIIPSRLCRSLVSHRSRPQGPPETVRKRLELLARTRTARPCEP